MRCGYSAPRHTQLQLYCSKRQLMHSQGLLLPRHAHADVHRLTFGTLMGLKHGCPETQSCC